MSFLGKFSRSDPELVEKTLSRLAEQDKWNDVFSTKLIEVLDKIDQVKSEIRERMRKADDRIKKAESVEQAEALLLDETAKAEEFANKLAMAECSLDSMRSEFLVAKNHYQGAETLHDESHKILAESKDHFNSARIQLDRAINRCENAVELATASSQDSQRSSKMSEEAARAYSRATQRLDTARSGFESALHLLQLAEATQGRARIESENARCGAAEARNFAEGASRDYLAAKEMQLRAARLARASARSATLLVTVTLLAMVWNVWFMVQPRALFWAAWSLSAMIVFTSIFIMRGIGSDN